LEGSRVARRPDKIDTSTDAGRIGAAIRKNRQRLRLRLADAAALLTPPVSAAEWSRWERGLVVPPTERLLAIARAMGCGAASLLP
jgi:transcriptional regulator with XRE-family HTH domain